jgi:hypothetical protein
MERNAVAHPGSSLCLSPATSNYIFFMDAKTEEVLNQVIHSGFLDIASSNAGYPHEALQAVNKPVQCILGRANLQYWQEYNRTHPEGPRIDFNPRRFWHVQALPRKAKGNGKGGRGRVKSGPKAKAKVAPKAKVTPKAKVAPKANVAPKAKVAPNVKVALKAKVAPKAKVALKVKVTPKAKAAAA